MGSAGVQPSSKLDWGLGFDQAISTLLNVSLQPLQCCLKVEFRGSLCCWKSQTSERLKQGFLKNFPLFSTITHSLNVDLDFTTTLSLSFLESTLVFMMSLAWWHLLISGVEDFGAFQNRCTGVSIQRTDKTYTGDPHLTNYLTAEGTDLIYCFVFFISLHQFGLLCVVSLLRIIKKNKMRKK